MKILVVDAHPLALDALRPVLVKLAGAVTVAAARSAEAVWSGHPGLTGIDLLLIDIGLPDGQSQPLLAEALRHRPGLPVVMLAGPRERQQAGALVGRGARGCLPKSASSATMLAALRQVLAGNTYVPEPEGRTAGIPDRPLETGRAAAPSPTLTARQLDVLKLMLQGRSNKDISRQLGLSPSTVKIHVAAVLKAFGVGTRAQVIVEAARRDFKYD
jgi:DNA-binding NarL/FixJ family response regulator